MCNTSKTPFSSAVLRLQNMLLLVATGLFVLGCGYDGPSIDVPTLKKKLDENPNAFSVVDVRPRSQFAKGHIHGARNIPLEEIDAVKAELLRSERPSAIICTSGKRSLAAVKKLRTDNDAQTAVILVTGGMDDWKKAGYPMEKSSDR
jgi:rhodanese-related sulfurtransferase